MAGWRLLVLCGLLAAPTALAPESALASATYLVGLALIVAALWWGTLRIRADRRRPWLLFALTATCWIAGDTAQRVLAAVGIDPPVGVPDLFWLASYAFEVTAVAAMVSSAGLSRSERREIRSDVSVVSIGAGVAAWRVLVVPAMNGHDPLLVTGVSALYPLGDVAVFSVATALLMLPGRRTLAGASVIGCLALTLPLDFLQSLLPNVAPGFDDARMDAAFLLVNALLGAGALHPGREQLAARPTVTGPTGMHRWRVMLLGAALCTISLVAALPARGTSVVPLVLASIGASIAVVLRFYGLVREREAAEAALNFQAHHDQLTGAANRALLIRRLAAAVRDRAGSPVLVFVDLDGFKSVNDTWGHAAGDQVLRVVADRLRLLVRSQDMVARVGGDEFVLLCHDVDLEQAELIGHRVRESVAADIDLGVQVVRVGASVGVHAVGTLARDVSDKHIDDVVDQWLRRADAAMYEAKRGGGGVRMSAAA
jgi:diguanylate cyclase (GGDEF)-like protein